MRNEHQVNSLVRAQEGEQKQKAIRKSGFFYCHNQRKSYTEQDFIENAIFTAFAVQYKSLKTCPGLKKINRP